MRAVVLVIVALWLVAWAVGDECTLVVGSASSTEYDEQHIDLASQDGFFNIDVEQGGLQIDAFDGTTRILIESMEVGSVEERDGVPWTGTVDSQGVSGYMQLYAEEDPPETGDLVVWWNDHHDAITVTLSGDDIGLVSDFFQVSLLWGAYYCGCEYGGGNITLCADRSCSPWPATQCPGAPPGIACYWLYAVYQPPEPVP